MSRNTREGRFCGSYRAKSIRSHHFRVVNRWAARIEGITRTSIRVLRLSTDPAERHAATWALTEREAAPRRIGGWF